MSAEASTVQEGASYEGRGQGNRQHLLTKGWWGEEGVVLGGLRVTEGRAQVKDEDLSSRSDTAKVSRLGKTPL